MRYTADEFLALIESVEAQGGVHLPEEHGKRAHMYEMPSAEGPRRVEVDLAYCGEESVFQLHYGAGTPVRVPVGAPKANPKTNREAYIQQIKDLEWRTDRPIPEEAQAVLKNGGGVVKVCAVDDSMGRWPRFA